MPSEASDVRPLGGSPWFTVTHWSVILRAASGMPEAQAQLCLSYWHPLYRYVCRRGYSEHDAEDLTQGFFAYLQRKEYRLGADPAKGKFRSLLLACLNHYLSHDRQSKNAQKRGNGCPHVPLQGEEDSHCLQLPAPTLTPEQEFDKEWAIALQTRAMEKLRDSFIAEGRLESFEAMKVFLTGDKTASTYAELAERLGTTPAALKQEIYRLRQDWREIWRREVSTTVPPDEVDGEIAALIQALCR